MCVKKFHVVLCHPRTRFWRRYSIDTCGDAIAVHLRPNIQTAIQYKLAGLFIYGNRHNKHQVDLYRCFNHR